MSAEAARTHLRNKGFEDRIITREDSTATVEAAAAAIGVTPGEIAKTLSFILSSGPVLIVAEGTARVDNKKFKAVFAEKARMIPFEEVEELTGHAPGGVCPFGAQEGVKIYLDESLRKYDTIYPAAGDAHSAVRLSVEELEKAVDVTAWVDVAREPGQQ